LSLIDKEHLPAKVTNIKGIRDILLAIDPEVILLRDDISQLKKEMFVSTAEKLLDLWEQDFGLTFNSSLTIQQRRQRILNKLARKKTLTWVNLRNLIKNNLTIKQIYIINDSENYHYRILVQDPNYHQMEQAVETANPAYLTFDIVLTEYARRTGTFNSGTEPL
jgi:hypothetical protein